MSDLRNRLQNFLDELRGMEERARKLKNQNLADVIAAAHGRAKQIGDHADLDLIEDQKDQRPAPTTKDEAIEQIRLDGDADPEGTAQRNWPHLFEPQRSAPFPQ